MFFYMHSTSQYVIPLKLLCIFVSSFPMSAGTLKEINDPVQGQTQLVSESVRNDVDQDVFLMFNVVDENLSWYLEDNIKNCSDPAGIVQDDQDFIESNLMHGEKFNCFSSFIKFTGRKIISFSQQCVSRRVKNCICSVCLLF